MLKIHLNIYQICWTGRKEEIITKKKCGLAKYKIRNSSSFLFKTNSLWDVIGAMSILNKIFSEYFINAANEYLVKSQLKSIQEDVFFRGNCSNEWDKVIKGFCKQGFLERTERERNRYLGECLYQNGDEFIVLYADSEEGNFIDNLFMEMISETFQTLSCTSTYMVLENVPEDLEQELTRLDKQQEREAKKQKEYPFSEDKAKEMEYQYFLENYLEAKQLVESLENDSVKFMAMVVMKGNQCEIDKSYLEEQHIVIHLTEGRIMICRATESLSTVRKLLEQITENENVFTGICLFQKGDSLKEVFEIAEKCTRRAEKEQRHYGAEGCYMDFQYFKEDVVMDCAPWILRSSCPEGQYHVTTLENHLLPKLSNIRDKADIIKVVEAARCSEKKLDMVLKQIYSRFDSDGQRKLNQIFRNYDGFERRNVIYRLLLVRDLWFSDRRGKYHARNI